MHAISIMLLLPAIAYAAPFWLPTSAPSDYHPVELHGHAQSRPDNSSQSNPKLWKDSAVNCARDLRPSNTTRVYLNHTTEPHHPIAIKAPTNLFNSSAMAYFAFITSSLGKWLINNDFAKEIELMVPKIREMQLGRHRGGSIYEQREKRATFTTQRPFNIDNKADGREGKAIEKPFRLTRGAGVINGHYDGAMRSSSAEEDSDCGPLDYKYLNERCVKSNKLD